MSETTTETASTTETKTKKGKAPKKTAKAKAAIKAKPAKAATSKREKAPKEDLMVFAFRISKDESAALHTAAGPANASRTMRSLAAAFVAEDRVAFEAVVEEARKLRS